MGQLIHDKTQEEYWDKIAGKRRFSKQREIPYPAIKEMEEFFGFVGIKPGKKLRILEIGCGTGRYTLPLLKRGHCVLGTELSRESLDLLKERARKEGVLKNLRVEQNSFENKKLCQKYFGKFDLVLMVAVIHHFDHQKREKIFKNIVHSVKKGGWVVALEPNPLNPLYYLLYFWRWFRNAQNVNRWATEKGMLFTNTFNLKRLFQQF